MRTWKWRIILSVGVVFLSIGMSPWFFNGFLADSPNLYFVISGLNVVPGSILDATFEHQLGHLYWTRGYWARFLFWEYQLMIFLFWWWVGWKIDLTLAARNCWRGYTIAEIVGGLGLSLMLFVRRGAEHPYPYRDAGPWLMMAWSVALLGYSLLQLRQLHGASGQMAR